MATAKPLPELSLELHARLREPLLALNAALEVDALWAGVRAVVRAAVPVHRVTLFLGHLGMGEARVVRTDPPIPAADEWFAARGEDNPFSPFIAAHRGVKLYRFEEVVGPREVFQAGEFYRRFAVPEGWDKGLSALYWARREVTAMFSLYRAPAEPVFTEAEVDVVRYLQPVIGIAIERVQKLHNERLARRGLEEFNRNIPVGLVFLDWELRVEFVNAEGQKECVVWSHGPEAARALNPRDAFAVPEEILAACRRLREGVQARKQKQLRSLPDDVAEVGTVARAAGRRAQITVLNNPANALAKPRFLVVLDARAAAPAGEAATQVGPVRMSTLRELSPREREIALLVCEGFSNAEIARRLSKSVLTIKTQLNSVFRKLGVNSRAKLMAMLR